MEIGADAVFVDDAFAAIFAVVAETFENGAKWLFEIVEIGEAGVIFVADDLTKIFAF